MEERIVVKISELKTFVIDVLVNTGLSREDAEITAEILNLTALPVSNAMLMELKRGLLFLMSD